MEERPQEEIEWHFERFIELIQKCQDEHCENRRWKYPLKRSVRVEKGRVYWAIWTDEEFTDDEPQTVSRIFGFVRRKDGAIFRAATYKKPETRTKNPIRGYIWEDGAEDTFQWHGVNYAMGS